MPARSKPSGRSIAGLVVVGALISACANVQSRRTGDEVTNPLAAPSRIRADLVGRKANLFIDPDSIRDARIGQVYACPIEAGLRAAPMTCVCVELNAKNRMGGYTGMQRRVAVYRNYVFESMKDAEMSDDCGTFEPFTELNGSAATR